MKLSVKPFSEVKMASSNMEEPKDWDFKLKFPNGMISYYHYLDIEYSKSEIIEAMSEIYNVYIDNYIYLSEYPDVKAIDAREFLVFKENIKPMQRIAVTKKFITFNKKSEMIGD